MAVYELHCEFDVTRRIGWSDDDLGKHIDEVYGILHQGKDVLKIDTRADLDTGLTEMTLRFRDWLTDDPNHVGRVILGVAISAAGAEHEGLLPIGESSGSGTGAKRYRGIKLPRWKLRNATSSRALDD